MVIFRSEFESRSTFDMSNGKSPSLKRAADAAFGGDHNQKSKLSRRKRSKISKPQDEHPPESKSTSLKQHASNSQNETPETPRSSRSGQKKHAPGAIVAGRPSRELRGHEGHKQMKRRRKQQESVGSDWSILPAEGGRFGDHDPVLVQSDQ